MILAAIVFALSVDITLSTAAEFHYFKENPNSTHLDARFSLGTPPHHKHDPALFHALVHSYMDTMVDLGITTWLAHGSLLGWYWGQRRLPWDDDFDFHISLQHLTFLAKYYNMTVYTYGHSSYLLDINAMFAQGRGSVIEDRTAFPDANTIDARWIDMQTGLFADITALSMNTVRGDDHSNGKLFRAKDGHEYSESDIYPLHCSTFEGCSVLVPYGAERILVREYGKQALTETTFLG